MTTGTNQSFSRYRGHHTFFLQCGPEDGPAIIFLHGFPELSITWRHMLPCFGALGWRAIAPDLRGYGRSSVYTAKDAYAQEKLVGDMVGLADSLGIQKAVWVGHDWGCGTAWSIASHHPERCAGVVNLSIPYRTLELGLPRLASLADRTLYPENVFPDGQWSYMRHYHGRFDRAVAVFDRDPLKTVAALFRSGQPSLVGTASPRANVYRDNGWFDGAEIAPDSALDPMILTPADLVAYAEGLSRNGFAGPVSYYMNDAANAAYTERAVNNGYLDLPVLFVAGRYDLTCEAVDSRLSDPMKEYCSDLTFEVVPAGHFIAEETPSAVNAILARWLATKVAKSYG